MQRDLASVLGDFVLDRLSEALVVLDPDGSLVKSNRAASASGRTDIVGLFDDARRDPRIETFLEGLRLHAVSRAEVESANGQTLSLDGVAIDGWFIVLVRDDSERRELDRELQQLRSGASLALVAATLVHDFNNLLTPVLLLSSRLVSELEKESRAAMLASEIHAAANLGSALMRDVLSLSRPRVPLIERVDVNEVVTERLGLIGRLVGDGVEIVPMLDPHLGDVLVDRKRFEHALLNLVANARDAMTGGGRVTIATRLVSGDDGPSISLAVTDTGVGMTDEVRRQAFESFFTTKADSGGTGIGLASVQRFARESGGHVALETAPLEGTTVTVFLPRLAASEESVASILHGAEISNGAGKILVADRDERVRRAIQIALEARGYTVVLASSAEGALEAAAVHRVDVALIDTQLTRRDHRGFLQLLRGVSASLRIVFLSVAPRAGSSTTDFEIGFLPKAFSDQELVRAVSEALGSLHGHAGDSSEA
jgi:two-component system, cell cycle sensor histidine kinase and response regulator CckA